MGKSAFVALQIHQTDVVRGQLVPLCLWQAFASQPEVNVFIDRLPWKESKLLKHNRSVRTRFRHHLVVDLHRPRAWKLQSSGHSHAGGFAATRWPHDGNELLVLHREVDAIKRGEIFAISLKNAGDFTELYDCHESALSL